MPDLNNVLPQKSESAPVAVKSAVPLHAEIDRWFQDSFHGTRLGNDTEMWNLVHAAKEDLKQRLTKIA